MSTKNPALLSLTLGELLAERARQIPERVYLRFNDQVVTYAELDRRANQVANGLLARGVGKGALVGLFMDNCVEFLYVYWAVARLGAVMVPMNTAYKADELVYAVNHSEQRLLFAQEHHRPVIEAALPGCPGLQEVIYVDGPAAEFPTWLQGPVQAPPDAGVKPTDPVGIMYTSGTTARPKGVMLHHRSYILASDFFCGAFGCGPDDVLYGFFPMFHANVGVYMVVGAALHGCTLAVRRGFSAREHWEVVRKHGATQVASAGSILAILKSLPPLPSDQAHPVRVYVNGQNVGSIKESFEERFGVVVLDAYSLTECMTGMIERSTDRATRTQQRLMTCGRPSDWVEAKIVDDEGQEVGPGVKGEILLRGPAVCLGYYKDPEATAKAFAGDWLRTGDIAYRDEEGYFYFCDRKKDMIKRRGENIASAEVERVLNMHPAVQESAVIGVPDLFAGEEVKAYIMLRPEMAADPWALVEHCRQYLEDFKIPRYFEYRTSFPRPTTVPKILKTALRAERADLTEGAFDRGPKLPPRA